MPASLSVTSEQVRWFRFRRSGLATSWASCVTAAERLAGVQAQIQSAAGLALANRVAGVDEAEVDRHLHEKRDLVKLWGQRGTLHLYAMADWPLIHGALDGRPTYWRRMAARDPATLAAYDAAVQHVGRELAARGELRRSDIGGGVEIGELDMLSSWGGVFYELTRQGEACHAGKVAGEGVFAHRSRWVPQLHWAPPERDAANVVLVRRYLGTYGPASAQDFAYWRGATVTEATRWFRALGDEAIPVMAEGRALTGLAADEADIGAEPPTAGAWPLRLLYRFDPFLLGHRDKTWLVEPRHYGAVWRPAGHIEATVLVDGRIRGTWNYRRRARTLDVDVRPFGRLPAAVKRQVTAAAAGAAAFFGLAPGALTVAPAEP